LVRVAALGHGTQAPGNKAVQYSAGDYEHDNLPRLDVQTDI
jgi:hypothetical protein